MSIKIFALHYRPDQIIPLEGWYVTVATESTGNGQDFGVTHFLPSIEPGQRIEDEKYSGNYSKYSNGYKFSNRTVAYSFHQPYGLVRTSCTFMALTQEVIYTLPDSIPLTNDADESVQQYLEAEDLIQKDAPEIASLAGKLKLSETGNMIEIVKRIYTYCHEKIQNAKFSGETDAVLTARLGEASCNGKSRLMVALCRHNGIPARLVGGLILQKQEKKTTHQWVEVLINGKWVPFCPLNGHFANKPANYLAFYRGDHGFFKHTKDIRFKYTFSIAPTLVPRDRGIEGKKFLDITSVWQLLEKSGIPLSTLGIILVIPVGALVTIIFRNVLGVQTFGTFLPALIAFAFMSTGLWWGMLIFFTIIAGGAAIDSVVSRLKLLHTPRLTVIMLFVVIALLSFGVWGIKNNSPILAQSLFFPLAIHTITIERFFIIGQERGIKKSFVILGWTMLAVSFCYMVMSSLVLQMLVVFFPETYLLILAAAVYLGRWTGMRASELYRFRGLIFNTPATQGGGNAH
jgi:transglutaminase-like putative cysteine protease